MGIKGRRVHMIEELSETIISFQRGKMYNQHTHITLATLCAIVLLTILHYTYIRTYIYLHVITTSV